MSDIGLRELLRLDLVFLGGPQQIIEERDVELEHLDELDDRPGWRQLNSPSKLNALGSLSLPNSAIFR